jgi:hypothetical protein
LEGFFYLGHVRACPGPLVERKVLIDSDQPEALTSRSLEVEVRVGYFKLPDETRFEDSSAHFLDIVRLDFQPDRSCGP